MKNFCKTYKMIVSIPSVREISSVNLFHKNIEYVDDDENLEFPKIDKNEWKLIGRPNVLISHSPDMTAIVVHLTGIKVTDYYKLEWTLI